MKLSTHLFNRFARLGVRGQLVTAFAAVLLLCGALGVVALTAMGQVDHRASLLSSKWLTSAGLLAEQLISAGSEDEASAPESDE